KARSRGEQEREGAENESESAADEEGEHALSLGGRSGPAAGQGSPLDAPRARGSLSRRMPPRPAFGGALPPDPMPATRKRPPSPLRSTGSVERAVPLSRAHPGG